jgi:hypothetical protein
VAIRFTLGGGAAEEAEALSMNLEGAFVAPDRSQTNVTAHLGDLELREETIAVGTGRGSKPAIAGWRTSLSSGLATSRPPRF